MRTGTIAGGLASLAFPLIFAGASFGYIRMNADNDPSAPLLRVNAGGMQVFLNNLVVPGATSSISGQKVTVIGVDSDPVGAVRAALASWNRIGTSGIRFLPLQTTPAGTADDGQIVISIASDANTYSLVNGVAAVTLDHYLSGSADNRDGKGRITRSDIILNPGVEFSTNGTTKIDLQGALTHELGHALGASHSGLAGATMFQTVSVNQRFLTSDDIAFADSVYPAATDEAPLGTISGKITTGAGAPVPYALMTLIDAGLDPGSTLGGLTGADGTYAVPAPPGSYAVYVEPLASFVPVNVYLTPAQLAQSVAAPFQSTMLGGAIPTLVTVNANSVSSVSFSVAPGATPIGLPYMAIGAAGKNGDIAAISQPNEAISIPSGQDVDLVFIGPGLDKTASISILGAGVIAGPVRVDSGGQTFGAPLTGLPLIRVTLRLPARSTRGLASIFIRRGSDTRSMSGVLVIGPPRAAFSAAAVVDGDAVGTSFPAVVSPGEIITIYGQNLGSQAGIVVADNPSSAGIYSKNTGDTRVLFDGNPAPVIYSLPGQVAAIVPYGVALQKSTLMQVEFQGVASVPVTVPVVATAPDMFLVNGAAAALNGETNTLNTAYNPETRGSGIVVIYATGFGQTSPPGIDGLIAGSPLPAPPSGSVAVSIGGQKLTPDQIKYAGAAPGLVAGVMQLNLQVPLNIPAGAAPVVVSVGGVSSPAAGIFVK